MKSDFLNFLVHYKTEITVAVITAIAALLFTEALPALLSFLRNCGSYLLAVLRGRRKEYRFEKKYLTWLINENKFLVNVPSQLLTAEHLPKQPELESIFITLHLKRSNEAPVELPASELVKPGAKTVILGDPGSGKTTQLRYLCLTFARLAKTSFFNYKNRRVLSSRFQVKGNRIPILIYLNRLTDTDNNLLSAVERLLPESLSSIYPAGYFQQLLEAGKCIILLDGLDEVPTASLRKRIAETISSLSNATNERNTWIASSRIVGYTTQLHNSFETGIVKPLTIAEVERFVENWYRTKCDTSGFPDAQIANQREIHLQRARNLITTIRLNPGLASLVTSPILVSLIALLHSVKIELPQSRPLLYRDCVELLADRWDLSRGLAVNVATPISPEHKIQALMSIASHMHNHRLREVSWTELEAIVSAKLTGLFEFSNQVLPGRIIDDLEARSGLLMNRGFTEAGEKLMAFSHLSFQEYLTARSLLSSPPLNVKEMLAQHFADSWWREAILLYVAQMESPRRLIEQIHNDSLKDNSLDKVLLAAACLSEVKLDKTDDLYIKIFSEVAFIYSCGEIDHLTVSLLECDKNNMLLRHMVDYLVRTTPQQTRGLHILLRMKRETDPKPGRIDAYLRQSEIDSYIRQYKQVSDVASYDVRIARAISKYQKLPTEAVLDLMLRAHSNLDVSGEILLAEPITTQQLATATMTESDWGRLIKNIVSISPHAIDGEDPQNFKDWKRSSILRLISKHQALCQKQQDDYLKTRAMNLMQECLTLIAEKNYGSAGAILATARGWWISENVREYEKEIYEVYRTTDAQGRRLCVMLLLRIQQIDGQLGELLIDFVNRTLSSVSGPDTSQRQKSDDERIAELEDLSLLNRVIHSLANYHFSTHDHLRFLLRCFESDLPEVVDFAESSIERLKKISDDSVNDCYELFNSSEPARLWAAISISSSMRTEVDVFIGKMLLQLCGKDPMFREKSIADHAAYGILKIISPVMI